MAKQRRDTLPFAQEQVVRAFITGAARTGFVIPPHVKGAMIGLMGYKVAPNGALIWKSIECRWRFGDNIEDKWTDTFESDWETLCEERDTTDSDSSADSGTSEPTEGN